MDKLDDFMRELSGGIENKFGETRVTELMPDIEQTAKQLTIVLAEPIALDENDPDFFYPLG